ncbi:CHAT domain-containing protein [Suillus plorans]|uniref:CHAT domain-containing protein n=1 Tax=Suillus plorans TaxID=116603 RepID=A0A9P7J1Q0_9AGAM|nr:CHAT domain-containing protein [Suillus plorans]KAG1799027.1 CHAT domain-containing protein [Suillus plorans]
MARGVTSESSNSPESDPDSDFSSVLSRKTSPTPPAENSAPSVEPFEGTKRERKLSDNDNDNKSKGSECSQSQKKDVSNEEPSHQEHLQNTGEMCITGVQRVVITVRIDDFQAIRATDLTLGLRRIPAGFHVVIKIDGTEYQTTNKPVHADQAVVEWNEHILLPCEPSSTVWVSVYASFELGPMLCHGEDLRTFEISVGELVDRSEKSHPIVFQPKQGEVISPCTSLFMTLEQRLSDENDTAVRPLTTLKSRDMDALALKTDAGHRLLARYRRTQNNGDLDQSIKHFERASDLCPEDHPCRPAALFNLATAKFIHCQANGTYLDLDIPINLLQDALYLRPTGHPDRPVTQLHLAIVLLSCFKKRRFEGDAHAAAELLSDVLFICHADSHIHRAAFLAFKTFARHPAGNTAAKHIEQERPAASMLPLSPTQFVDRAKQCLHIDDSRALDEVISLHYNALGYYNAMHNCRGQLLCNLGTMLHTRFQRQGNGEDLDQAIPLLSEALALSPVGHTHRSSTLNNLAVSLSSRFDHQGNDEDLDQAIALLREALVLCPVGHTHWSGALNNLATRLFSRFRHRGHVEDLDEAIALQREALALHPVGHADRYMPLNNLATQLSSRFKHRGNDEDLDETIALYREALALCPVGHTGRSVPLHNLANGLSARFDHRGNDEDLDEAISFHREALALCPVAYRQWSGALNDLANQLSTRFEHRGNDEDLDEAITLYREALALRPVGHTDRHIDRPLSLTYLANALSDHFHHRGNDQDLDEAIALLREALVLCPVGHTYRSSSLNTLAVSLSTRYHHQGNDEDLDEAVVLQREALALRPIGHTHRSAALNNLATQLSSRFDHRGNDEDLDETISLYREALALQPVGHTHRPASLNNLANQLSMRFHHRDNSEDLDEAITLHNEELALCPVGHTDRSIALDSLANRLSTRFEHRSNDKDLDDAIVLHREALALRPVGHANRSASLNNLSARLSTRFEQQGNDKDLDEAVTLLREALVLCPVGHTNRPASLHNLVNQLSTRFHHRRNGEDLTESRENLRCALTLLTEHDPRQLEIHASLATIYLLFHDDQSRIDSTSSDEDTDNLNTAMTYLKAAVNVIPGGLLSRLTLAVDAASCALHSGDVCRAVELLEQGRTIIWTQMTRLRTPLDSLQDRGDHTVALTKKFRDLSSLLDKPAASHPEGTPRVNVEAEETRYRRLVQDWNGTIEEIRKINGFSRFLLPPLFSNLQDAARDGPIVVLIASESSCNAIIIPHQQPPTSIQLPANFEKLTRLVLALREAVQKDAGPKGKQPALIKGLRELWEVVVRPVVEKLGGFARRGSRIWWCPTSLFNFLPLHAAGEYRANGESLSQQYVSSYTPSLTALVRARRSHDKSLSVSFVAIGQDCPAGAEFTLDAVEPELELVRSLLPQTVSFTKVTSVDATKSRALHALRDNTWLHFACHGTQNYDEPFNSAFLMRDQPLSLLDITQMDLSLHSFAFLSACETAVGAFSTPDEVIHLAAGLQFAGVKSVVGTLWKVNDNTVQRLVEAFYKNMCGDGTMNSKRAARALHRAVQLLACDKDIPLDQRIVFVHIGV